MSDTTTVNHIIGAARIQRTAVLVVDYLKKRFPAHREFIQYRANHQQAKPLQEWQIIRVSDRWQLDDEKMLIQVCRALVAGCGDYDIWA